MTAPSRPLLRYHGGKWMLAPWVIQHLPRHRIYVEPFGGAASVLLRKPRSYAEVYNDLDGDVVNLFRVVRKQPEALDFALRWTPFARSEFELAYKPTSDPLELARRLVTRSFMGFGSNAVHAWTGFRANANRNRTTPAHDWANYPRTLGEVAERLRGVVIENRPAADVIDQQDSAATLFYCDPPYVSETRCKRSRFEGYAHEMDDAAHEDLAEVLHGVDGMVVLSGYGCPLYDRLYGDWPQVSRLALADGARERTEVLWISPRAWEELRPPLFREATP